MAALLLVCNGVAASYPAGMALWAPVLTFFFPAAELLPKEFSRQVLWS